MALVSSWSEFDLYWWQWVIVAFLALANIISTPPDSLFGLLLSLVFAPVVSYAVVWIAAAVSRKLRSLV